MERRLKTAAPAARCRTILYHKPTWLRWEKNLLSLADRGSQLLVINLKTAKDIGLTDPVTLCCAPTR